MGGKVGKQSKQGKKASKTLFNENKEKETSTLQIILLWSLITLLFISAVLLILATFANVNIFDQAKEWSEKLPFISEMKQGSNAADHLVWQEKVVDIQAEIQEKAAVVNKLQKELDQYAEKNEGLLIEQEKLLNRIAQLERDQEASKRSFQEVLTTYEQMSAKSAAPIISRMGDTDAIRILTGLKPNTLASILEKMSPEDAAKYTTMMSK